MGNRRTGSSDGIDLESQKRRAKRRREQQRKARRQLRMMRAGVLVFLFVVLIGCIWGVVAGVRFGLARRAEDKALREQQIAEEEEAHAQKEQMIQQARDMATVYDYQGAIDLLKSMEGYENDAELLKELADFESIKSTLVGVDVMKVPHLYLGQVSVDPEYTFSKTDPKWIASVNKSCITITELERMLEQMYNNGFVLIGIRDVIREVETDKGSTIMTRGRIRLPEGKKAFILSQEDVSYPFLTQNSGFASKMVLDEKGELACEYIQKDGTKVVGAYDLVPILENFIQEHPDFVYKNARPTLCFTGYNGILGYRTSPLLGESAEFGNIYAAYGLFDYKEETEAVKPVLKKLYEKGWSFAMNGYAAVNYAGEYDRVSEDLSTWLDSVGQIVESVTGKPTDIIMFPFGSDVADWRGYEDNETYDLLHSKGLRFYCSIQQNDRYWIQIQESYVRQGRRGVNGLRMYQDLNTGTKWVEDLFDVSTVYDTRRPETGLVKKDKGNDTQKVNPTVVAP